MTGDGGATEVGDTSLLPPVGGGFEELRAVLLHEERLRLDALSRDMADLEARVGDNDALVAAMTPVVGSVIRRKVTEAREEMAEALYPLVGGMVARAVRHALRELAESVDAQVRTSFSPRILLWRLRARLGGVPPEDLALRGVLPFEVREIYLIHRPSGLVLQHVARESRPSPNPDLVAGLLTALGDFAQDTLGTERGGGLEVVQNEDQRIVVASGTQAYLAALIEGIEPPGFAERLEERVVDIVLRHDEVLRHFDGDVSALAAVEPELRALLTPAQPRGLTRRQRDVLLALSGLLACACISTAWVARWSWQRLQARPVAPASVAAATPTAVWRAFPDASPPLAVLLAGQALRRGPAEAPAPAADRLAAGTMVEILAVDGAWYRVRPAFDPARKAAGWVLARDVGVPLPRHIVTPPATRPSAP